MLHKNAYTKFKKDQLILRDMLAIDRTILSSERSLLAYIRTGVTIFLAGISLLKLFDAFLLHLAGWALIVIAAVTVLIGYMRRRKMKKLMHHISASAYAKEIFVE